MPPKSRSSTSKATSTPKSSSLGFGSSKKGVSGAAGKGKGKNRAASPETPSQPVQVRTKSALSGLYPRLYKESLRKMGKPTHNDDPENKLDDIEVILRVFDASDEYGPCSRLSRLERFERAEVLGLEPDPEIGEILRSEDGMSRSEYRDSVFTI
ncbi:hypothetical protein JCM10213_007738 [Rhodosporidiobolus nylandii]